MLTDKSPEALLAKLALLVLCLGGMSGGAFSAERSSGEAFEVLPLRGSLHLIVTGETNVVVSVGPDGVLLADTGPEAMTDAVMAAVGELRRQYLSASSRAALPVGGAETRSTTKLLFNTSPQEDLDYIRYILNTSARPEHNGGNAGIAVIPQEMSSQDPDEKVTRIYAHENVLLRLAGASGGDAVPFEFWPSDVYYEEFYKLPHFNGEGIQLIHAPSASTDGDSFIWFRGSDVISAGDIYRKDQYPEPDVAMGGSIQGLIDGLNALVDLGVPEYRAEGGTLIVPGHGRVSDVSDVANYRDMVTIIRDRVANLVDKGMTLEQVKAAKPSFDFDGRYGRDPDSAERFIESIYLSLSEAME